MRYWKPKHLLDSQRPGSQPVINVIKHFLDEIIISFSNESTIVRSDARTGFTKTQNAAIFKQKNTVKRFEDMMLLTKEIGVCKLSED